MACTGDLWTAQCSLYTLLKGALETCDERVLDALIVRWRDNAKRCKLKKALYTELEIFVSGAIPEGYVVSSGLLYCAIAMQRCDLVEAFVPRMGKISATAHAEMVACALEPAMLPVLDMVVDLHPVTKHAIWPVTGHPELPRLLTWLGALPHAMLAEYADPAGHEVLRAFGVRLAKNDDG
jgi:hypothetical protein